MCSFISDLYRGGNWGWVIYRTTFTSESDQLVPQAIAKIDSYTDSIVKGDSDIKDFHVEIMALYDNVIIEDPSLDQASFDQLRPLFKKWLATQDGYEPSYCGRLDYPRWNNFIVIDEEAMKSIISAPATLEERLAENPLVRQAFVKMVDLEPAIWKPGPTGRGPPKPDHPRFIGWMRVELSSLYDFWIKASILDFVRICPKYITGFTEPFYGGIPDYYTITEKPQLYA